TGLQDRTHLSSFSSNRTPHHSIRTSEFRAARPKVLFQSPREVSAECGRCPEVMKTVSTRFHSMRVQSRQRVDTPVLFHARPSEVRWLGQRWGRMRCTCCEADSTLRSHLVPRGAANLRQADSLVATPPLEDVRR